MIFTSGPYVGAKVEKLSRYAPLNPAQLRPELRMEFEEWVETNLPNEYRRLSTQPMGRAWLHVYHTWMNSWDRA